MTWLEVDGHGLRVQLMICYPFVLLVIRKDSFYSSTGWYSSVFALYFLNKQIGK
ncbi:predicted protein [Sclerotinia sclerotiorum 1980 UF-70]|uniref:Uncharacterized protein n=1 Tax=Sclerotinia sclerotiorum (strain ATCC 18683 / 1980 / Ss-1) TaxID=665079 RepID=A7F9J3_SCLS1|nr:predicted protein [Sclerotinia sclerotiorum 1980 UF-70]EDO00404.1 predicted protein [Sclerotinia sclerotiorum 1980 UF-70]